MVVTRRVKHTLRTRTTYITEIMQTLSKSLFQETKMTLFSKMELLCIKKWMTTAIQ